MNVEAAYGDRGQQMSLTQVGDRARMDNSALQRGEGQPETPVSEAVVVELGRSSTEATTYTPTSPRAETTVVLDNGTSLKLSAKAGQSEGGGGPARVGEGTSVELNLRASTTVAGGSLVVMDAAKMKSSVRVDMVGTTRNHE